MPFRTLFVIAAAWISLAAGAADEGFAALRATRVDTPAAALPYAEALDRAGRPDAAARLRSGALRAHLDALDGRAPAAPATIGSLIDGAAGGRSDDEALARDWQRAFERHVSLRWDPTLPAEIAPQATPWRALASGVWTSAATGSGPVLAAIALTHRFPTPITLPDVELQLSGRGGGLMLWCRPPAGAPPATAAQPLPAGEARALVCRGHADGEAAARLARAARGEPAPGDRLLLQPTHARRAGGWEALAQAIGSATPLDTADWVRRLQAVATVVAPASAATPLPAAAPTPTPTRTAPTPAAPPAAWRPALAVAGGFAMLLLAVRLIYGRLNEDPPGIVVLRTLPWIVLVLGMGAAVGSPWGQQAIAFATGTGLRDAALALQQANARAPSNVAFDAVIMRFGVAGPVLLVGIVFFGLERLLMRFAIAGGLVKVLTVPLRLLVFVPVAMAIGAPGGSLLLIGLLLVTAVLFGLSLAVTLMLHAVFERLDDEDLSWPGAIRRAVTGTVDFAGRAGPGEFWGYLLFSVAVLALAFAFWPAARAPLALVVAVPLPALVVRRLRVLGDVDAETLLRPMLRALLRAIRRRR